MAIEHFADGGDAPIHHVGRRHHVGSRANVRERRGRDALHGRIIDHLLALDDPAVAVIRVFTQADVRNDHQVGDGRGDGRHGSLHDSIRRVGTGPSRILRIGNPEKNDRRHA